MYIDILVKYRYASQILMKPEVSRQIFEKKSSNTKFHENPLSGNRLFNADRHDEANSHFSQICKRLKKQCLQGLHYK